MNTLADNGYTRVKLEVLAKKLADKFVEISATLEELAASAVSISEQQQGLNGEISQVKTFTEEINQVLKDITKIALNTKLLGFNASIEAAHAGEVGKGFAVVAEEIQNLSESSRETADHILQLTEQIKKSIDSTVTQSQSTLYTTEEQSAAMEEVAAAVQEIVNLADELSSMMKTAN